jgi:hypothetical protein
MNIYNLYISFSKSDHDVFKNILTQISKNVSSNNLLIIQVDVSRKHKIPRATVYKFESDILEVYEQNIRSVRELLDLFQIFSEWKKSYTKNVFIYSGHSDGIIISYQRTYIMNLQDLSTLVLSINGKKFDLFIADTCLLGSLNALYQLRICTKYVLASPSYCDYLSFLQTKSVFKFHRSIVTYSKNLINEMIRMYKKCFQDKSFMIHFCLYSMNKYLDKLIDVVKQNMLSIQVDKKDRCAINKKDYYYTDLNCKMNTYHIDISELLSNIILINKSFDVGNNQDSDLILIIEKPYDHFSYHDPFLV